MFLITIRTTTTCHLYCFFSGENQKTEACNDASISADLSSASSPVPEASFVGTTPATAKTAATAAAELVQQADSGTACSVCNTPDCDSEELELHRAAHWFGHRFECRFCLQVPDRSYE